MFYDKFAELCKQKGVSVTRACEEIGLARTIATKWKNTGATPRGDTLKKISDYFGVSVSSILDDDEETKVSYQDENALKFALFHGADVEITDEMYEEVKRFAAFVAQREKEKKG